MNDDRYVEELFDGLMAQCEGVCKEPSDYDKIRDAFYFARDAHSGVKRKSGEPYITHPIAVARIAVEEMGLGVKSIQAALLHDVVEDTDYTLEDISFRFGDKVAKIVDGLTKLSGVFDNRSSEQAENFKRMLLTLSDDVRVILIKIADRLHNMRTLGSMLPHKQMKIASETIYLFAPLAHRLGLYAIKSELEDLSLKFRFRSEYAEIEEKLDLTRIKRNEYIDDFNSAIIDKLKAAGIDFTISARVKSVYSIWKKLKTKQIDFSEIYDLFAIRIVFNPVEGLTEKTQCWHIYSLLTDVYRPKMDRIRDWVTTPKANGYEALHCTVMGPGGVWSEVQIRSKRMDDIAERGFAAHWSYKQNSQLDNEIDPLIDQLRHALNRPTEDAVEFLDNFKLGLQVSEIMVFTPKGESKTMPKGSTALDFAYEIHSKIGSSAIGAKINYKLVPIYTPISAGDQIEIITSSSVTPQKEWLDNVITAKAKYHIKQALKGNKSQSLERGREIFEAKMRELGVPIRARVFHKILPVYGVSSKTEFYLMLGSSVIELNDLDKVLKTNTKQKFIKYWSLQFVKPFRGNRQADGTQNAKKDQQNMIIAECCHPIAGDEVIGFEQEAGYIEVHKKLCPIAIRLSAQQGNSIVAASWSSEKILSYLTTVEVRGIDRIGILLDVTKIISEQLDVNIREVSFSSHDGIFEGKIALYVRNNEDLKDIMDQVSSVKGIERISRVEVGAIS